MKIKLSLLAAAALSAIASAGAEKIELQPPHWWAGMNSPSLQIQVHARNIREAQPSISYPGVRIDSVARLDGSPDWQYIYLDISPEARPGKFRISWRDGKKKFAADYELRQRRTLKGARGFDASDVLYLLMPDRFANGNLANDVVASMRFPAKTDRTDPNVRHGGDIKGIADHIDYIDSLGVTAVWVNPVLENDMPGGSYHGYATTDYYKIDPRFGSNAEYTALIDSLHDRGIKTVMDMIFNHCGSEHPWALDPPASDWFNHQGQFTPTNHKNSTFSDPYASGYDRDLAVNGWFVKEMPDLNQNNPHLMKYLSQNSIWWIEESEIDGIRMDTYPYADPIAMARWIDDVEKEYPDFTITGECWFSEPALCAYWQKGSPQAAARGFDSNLPVVMDFPLMLKSRGLKPFQEQTDAWNGLNTLYDHFALDFLYKDPLSLLRFLDNHDTERFITTPPDSLGAWKQAVAMLLTVPGIPQLYYGTELLMSGTREGGDGNVRKDMPGGFPGDEVSQFSRDGRSPLQNEAFDFISTILRWRKGSEAIAKGGMTHFQPSNGLYLYKRTAPDGDAAIIILNGTDSDNDVDMTRYAEAAGDIPVWTDILTGQDIVLIPEEGYRLFAPREVRILVPAKK